MGQQYQNQIQTIGSRHRIMGQLPYFADKSLSVCINFLSTGSKLKILGINTAGFCEEIFKLQVCTNIGHRGMSFAISHEFLGHMLPKPHCVFF
jgi:hypothetical protein